MRSLRLRGLAPVLWGLTASLLVLAPVTAPAQTGGTNFSAYAMRPLPAKVQKTTLSWPIPFAQQQWDSFTGEPGTGAFFTYQTWFQLEKRHTLHDGVVAPAPNVTVRPFQMQGQVVVRDRSGSRVLEAATVVNSSGLTEQFYSLFADGTALYHQNGTGNAGLIPLQYGMPVPAGIEAFLKGVKIHGIVRDNTGTGDLAMTQLLESCGARQIGTDRQGTGPSARQMIYGIPASAFDQQLGYEYLRIWVRVGDFRIVRTELSLVWGTERTDFHNVMDGRQFDDAMFRLPGE